MNRFNLLLVFLLLFANGIFAQKKAKTSDLLLSGPMVGYTEMREALLWVQTNGPAQVFFEYQEKDNASATAFRTPVYLTNADEAYTARLIANQVQPGKTYTYKVFIGGKEAQRDYPLTFKTPPLWQWRSDPPEMKIALGSCTFINEERYDRPGKGYGGDYGIFNAISAKKPDMMLWLGDNIYLREPDFYTTTGIIHRYTHTRHTPEMQALLGSTANYAIWDDHDYGPNNSDKTFIMKDETLRAFKLFWGNPSYGVYGHKGITSTFVWGDAQFFMVDNRYFRTPNNKKTGEREVIGKEQLDWLVDALISSNARFKFVMIGGQVLNTVEAFENLVNLAPQERLYLLNAIARERIYNVIFLTGDRHHSELSFWEKEGVKVYDFTVSPLTSGSHDASAEANQTRVEGSHVGVRNFGTMGISGKRLERKLTFKFFDQEGKEIWSKAIEAQYPPKRR
ncbi:MAG: alkaline phosphatase family protein [Bacteroidia bacterium]|nr:alkaline phosphatase family protein [Bacteroidia bacterium]